MSLYSFSLFWVVFICSILGGYLRICSKAAQSSKISRGQDLAIYNSGHATYLLFITHTFLLHCGSFLKFKNQIAPLLDNACCEAPENRKRGNGGKIWTNESACSRSPSKKVTNLGINKYWPGKWTLWKCQGPKHMFHL